MIVQQIITEAQTFLTSKLSTTRFTTENEPKTQKLHNYENNETKSDTIQELNDNDEIALKILKQIELLKKENLNLQSITEKDLVLLDETDGLVESNLMNMKGHNVKVSIFASKAWKKTGLYWMIISLSIMLFFVAFMIIKIFPRLF